MYELSILSCKELWMRTLAYGADGIWLLMDKDQPNQNNTRKETKATKFLTNVFPIQTKMYCDSLSCKDPWNPNLDRKQAGNAAQPPQRQYFLMIFWDVSKDKNEKRRISKGRVKSQRSRTKQGLIPEGKSGP